MQGFDLLADDLNEILGSPGSKRCEALLGELDAVKVSIQA
jgi:hypothetical protein